MLLIDDKRYYKVNEAADLAGVNTRTLRRWLAGGNLAHFLFPFRKTPTGPMYYRLEPPEETDTKWEGTDIYRIPGLRHGEEDGHGAGNGNKAQE